MRTVRREDLIDEIRAAALQYTDEQRSFCEAAGCLGIGCHGFRRLNDVELRRQYGWLDKDAASREHLEDLANRWQLVRQQVRGKALACDVQVEERDGCLGWDEYSNDELVTLFHQICSREEIQVI